MIDGGIRPKNDRISSIQSHQAKIKKNGNKYNELQDEKERLLKTQQNIKIDCFRQTVAHEFKHAKTITAENLQVFTMLLKIINECALPANQQKRGSRALRRIVQNASMGMLLDWIKWVLY